MNKTFTTMITTFIMYNTPNVCTVHTDDVFEIGTHTTSEAYMLIPRPYFPHIIV